ncbi:hypothetical protein Elgi_74740 [Paenibacillus elgii]|nr:hypothetical protein Elgi_74740 [Paenibacillus elgii]
MGDEEPVAAYILSSGHSKRSKRDRVLTPAVSLSLDTNDKQHAILQDHDIFFYLFFVPPVVSKMSFVIR